MNWSLFIYVLAVFSLRFFLPVLLICAFGMNSVWLCWDWSFSGGFVTSGAVGILWFSSLSRWWFSDVSCHVSCTSSRVKCYAKSRTSESWAWHLCSACSSIYGTNCWTSFKHPNSSHAQHTYVSMSVLCKLLISKVHSIVHRRLLAHILRYCNNSTYHPCYLVMMLDGG